MFAAVALKSKSFRLKHFNTFYFGNLALLLIKIEAKFNADNI